jgi:hypothetical protein
MSSAGSTEAAYRDCRDRLEDAVKKLLVEKVAKEHADELSQQTTLASYLEDAASSPRIDEHTSSSYSRFSE